MSLDFDGTGDLVTCSPSGGWFRDVNKGAEMCVVEWDVPASEVDGLMLVDRGTGGGGSRVQIDASSFAPAAPRLRTRRADNDSEDFSSGGTALGSALAYVVATVDWTAVATAIFKNAVEDASSPFTPGWATGNTSDTDPQNDATFGAAFNGLMHLMMSWHRELTLTEIEIMFFSDGLSLILEDLQNLHYLNSGSVGDTATETQFDISDQGRNGTITGNPVYAETLVRGPARRAA